MDPSDYSLQTSVVSKDYTYAPHDGQSRFHLSCDDADDGRVLHLVAFVAGFGAGKTRAGAEQAALAAVANPGSIGLLVSPSLKLGSLQSGPLSHLRAALELHAPLVTHTYLRSRLEVVVQPYGSRIQLVTALHPERIVGVTAAWAWCDEPGMYPPGVLDRVISRLRDVRASCRMLILTGTPEGVGNDFHRLCTEASPGALRVHHCSSRSNHANLAPDYLDQLYARLDPAQVEAYLEGRFVPMATGRAYLAFDQDRHVAPTPFEPHGEVALTCDFNISPLAWIITQPAGDRLRVPPRGVVTLRNADSWQGAEEVSRRLVETGWRGGTLRIYGDSSGQRGGTRSRHNDYDIIRRTVAERLHEAGIPVAMVMDVPAANPSVRDSVSLLNHFLRRAAPQGLAIDPVGNQALIDDLCATVWTQEGESLDKRQPDRTHLTDALRYLVNRRWPLRGAGGDIVVRRW